MRIVVNHITRMGSPRICVAGLDVATLAHIRPTTPPSDLITRQLLRENGGPFSIGAVVDLGPVRSRPDPPETEDHGFQTRCAKHVEDLSGDDFCGILDEVSGATLADGFGPELERIGWKYAVEAGRGDRSLAVVRASRRPLLEVDQRYGRLQLRLDDPGGRTYLSVTDARFYDPDQTTIREDVVADVASRLRYGVDAYLMLGLARAYQSEKDDRARHWLQLNGLVLTDRPIGEQP